MLKTPFVLESFADVAPYFEELLNRPVTTMQETIQRISDADDLGAHIQEEGNRRYVHHTCDTTHEQYKQAYLTFITDISPKLQETWDALHKKLVSLPGLDDLVQKDEAYAIYVRSVKKALAMYREENIPLHVALAETEREYGEIAGAMTIEYDDKTLTLQQAAVYVERTDRKTRQEVYEKIWERRLRDKDRLDELLTKQIALRNTLAKNAGYPSFVEYQWDAYNRFDYTQEDVFAFHEGVKEHVVPFLSEIFEKKARHVACSEDTYGVAFPLQPFDLAAPAHAMQPLHPFTTTDELLEKGTAVMAAVSPVFGENIRAMQTAGRFDLASRPGKSPGGYNCSMPVSQAPFIFMNAAGTQRDVETFVHEAGHAMHSFCMKGIPLAGFRDYPMEIAEVASMSMELLTSEYWNIFYPDPVACAAAQKKHIDESVETLPRVSVIDTYQYWLYKNPDHTIAERQQTFAELLKTYQPRIDYTQYPDIATHRWQAQLHIFEVPFYYIEYGISQLAAFGIWKNYVADKQKTLTQYTQALALGYTRKIPFLYETAGISFDFSPEKIRDIMHFVTEKRRQREKDA